MIASLLKIVTMRLLLFNRNQRGIEEPLFTFSKNLSALKLEPESSFGLSETVSESFFPPSCKSSESLSAIVDDPTEDDLAKQLEVSIPLFKESLSYFNQDDIVYKPFDIVFHSPPYTGREKLQLNLMKEAEFELLGKRLNVGVKDGPFPSPCDLMKSEKLRNIKSEDAQEACNQLGCVLVILSNNHNLPVTSFLPESISKAQPVVIMEMSGVYFSTKPLAVEEGLHCECRKGACKTKCKCYLLGRGCNQRCRCLKCDNPVCSKEVARGCKCGQGASRSKEDCSEPQCPCFKNSVKCDSLRCSCLHSCQLSTTGSSMDESRRGVTRAGHAGKLDFKRSSQFLENKGLPCKAPSWTLDENLVFHLLRQDKKRTKGETTLKFNQVVRALPGLDLDVKNGRQISSKIQFCDDSKFKFSPVVFRNYLKDV